MIYEFKFIFILGRILDDCVIRYL